MDASDLKIFEAVARLGSMKRAAEELNTVQSNVTARIKALEDDLGLSLFQRHARGVKATGPGQRMLPFAGRVAKLLADARAAAKDDGMPNGPLQIGSLETTTALRLAPLLSRFTLAYPEVQLVVTTGTTARLVTDVLEYRVDGAFAVGPIEHPDLERQVAFTEELVLVTPPTVTVPQALAKSGTLRTIVFQYGCSYRQKLEAILSSMGIANAKPLELGSLDAMIACVSVGVGVTLLPRRVVAHAVKENKVLAHALPQIQSHAETLFIRRKDTYTSSAMKAFLKLCEAQEEVG
ncbi:LysR family transcriptional regulator [Acidocella aminolytica]|uniref:Transcriptional regulator LysR n=1 Tax=Acidocella aminolytica 101 = DSM 11237 TaxID=1120923 RepID=A0A0D6PCM7_9PROT|nr:LysR family transcriptional regulator [Acidocella aminolytica]GAN78968.1 transcriptional regulator LysR [Acidocella aminolytica 101 = DSM 11237]GBQ34636.1 transcriptional regulator [Acidocella aminolytica 101 = DSM 11237]SHF10933.1 DNA-binding transcriptional regulator, LysR family [Acidocella aminolytica 101 = DSM 11237]